MTPELDWEARLAALEGRGVRLGLGTVRQVLETLGGPERRLPHVLVAGTNGKGSAAAALTAILAAAGYRTGLYTSPHLESARERLRIDGLAIDDRAMEGSLERVLAAARKLRLEPPTYFEALTLAAFSVFEEAAEIAVLEVGMGGRLDATNAGEPMLSVVTEVGLDHQEFLGEDLASIAREKAGVLRAGRPAVVATTVKPAREAIEMRGEALGARLHDVAADTAWKNVRIGRRLEGTLETPTDRYGLECALVGRHQLLNLAAAVRAAELLGGNGWGSIDRPAIERGIRSVAWPGRLEWVELGRDRRALLDAAHNPAAALALAEYLDELSDPPPTLVFGALGDKDVANLLPPLARRAVRVVLTRPQSSRALAPEALTGWCAGRPVEILEAPEEALASALGAPGTVLVCGSIYLVGAARALLRDRFGQPLPAVEVDVTGRRVRGAGSRD